MVNETPAAEALWSVAEIAARDGISKAAVSKRVKKLVASGLYVERNNRGAVVAINVVQYDQLAQHLGVPAMRRSPVSASITQTTGAGCGGDDLRDARSREEADRRNAWIKFEANRLNIAEARKELLRRDKVLSALDACASELCRVVDALPSLADDLSAAVDKGGLHGLRSALKGHARDLRFEMSRAMRDVAKQASAHDPDLIYDDVDQTASSQTQDEAVH